MPEKYYTDGLLTKQVNSGDDPEPHIKYGWLRTVLNHIHADTPESEFIYETTAFLSFTSDKDRAFYFLTEANSKNWSTSDKKDGNAFIFTLHIPMKDLKELSTGVYLLKYKCNYDRTRTDKKFLANIPIPVNCSLCSQLPDYEHEMLVINAPEYLFQFKDEYLIEYSSAVKDSEWLLLPKDPLFDGNTGIVSKGWQSRIHIADFWSVDFFKTS